MKIANTRLKKAFIIVSGTIILIVLVILLLISPISKYLIEKYDEELTGRQIKIGQIYVNPLTGYINIDYLKVYDSKILSFSKDKDLIFFSAKRLRLNFAMLKLLSKTIEISEFTIDHPRGIIAQNKKVFNFNDLIVKFSSDKSDTISTPLRFSLLNIKMTDGEFYYREKAIPVYYFIKEVYIESSGLRWNADTIATEFSFLSGPATGSIKGDMTINIKNMDYRIAVIADKFDLKFVEQYLKDMVNYGSISASLDADFNSTGNFINIDKVTNKGLLVINDFHFGKSPEDDYVSFDKLSLTIIEISPGNHIYIYDSISLSHPYFKYERYDYLDNIQTMFGINGANISAAKSDKEKFNLILEIADYMKVLSRNFFKSDYRINCFSISNGIVKFNDYSISEKFSIEANPLFIVADSINKNHKRVNISLKSGILPYGNFSVNLSINPKDSTDFDLQYNIQKLPAAMFNPYVITYTSFPIDRGTIELSGTWNVRNGLIQSENHLVIIDPRVIKRHKNEDLKWIPVPMIMSFIRERGNVIDYEIPITGNLNEPEFHLNDVLFDVIKNIFVKPATIPYRIHIKNVETEIEKSLTVKWEMLSCSLHPKQERFIKKMADYLIDNPDATIDVYPQQFAIKEKEYLLFFEAKKKYYLTINNVDAQSFSKTDSLKVVKMSVKDSLFVLYIDEHINGNGLFTIQEKCNYYTGTTFINSQYKKLNRDREDVFLEHFKKKEVDSRVRILSGENNIPYNGFSFYKILYKGELPESLIKAHNQMNELNDEGPRKTFENDRRKNKNIP